MPRKSDSKRSFKIFNDYIKKVDLLSDEEAGKLFKAILGYVNDTDKGPVFEDRAMTMAFTDFRYQFDRDKTAYDWRCKINQMNGEKGGRPKQEMQAKAKAETMAIGAAVPEETEENRKEPNETEKTESVIKTMKKNEYSNSFKIMWEQYPRKDNKAEAYRNYQRRLKDGYTPEQLYRAVMEYKKECERDHRPKQYTYKCRTFLDVTGQFQEYLPKEKEQEEAETEQKDEGYNEVDLRKYI